MLTTISRVKLERRLKISYYVIAGLFILLILQQACESSGSSAPKVTTKIKTIYHTVRDTVEKTVPVKEISYIKVTPDQFPTGETIADCKDNFQRLLKDYLVKTTYADTIRLQAPNPLDSLKMENIGTITIIDTVKFNKLTKRIYLKDYKIPLTTITTTIEKEREPVRQFYIGGGLAGNQDRLQSINPGILYKTKKDAVYQFNVNFNTDGNVIYNFGRYWKISLRKKDKPKN